MITTEKIVDLRTGAEWDFPDVSCLIRDSSDGTTWAAPLGTDCPSGDPATEPWGKWTRIADVTRNAAS